MNRSGAAPPRAYRRARAEVEVEVEVEVERTPLPFKRFSNINIIKGQRP